MENAPFVVEIPYFTTILALPLPSMLDENSWIYGKAIVQDSN